MSRTTLKMFLLCLLISQITSTLSLNMQVENTSRKHQEQKQQIGLSDTASQLFHRKWDYPQYECMHNARLDLISIIISLAKKMWRRWKKWTTVTPNEDSSVEIVNRDLVWSFHPYLMIKFDVTLICYTNNVLHLQGFPVRQINFFTDTHRRTQAWQPLFRLCRCSLIKLSIRKSW